MQKSISKNCTSPSEWWFASTFPGSKTMCEEKEGIECLFFVDRESKIGEFRAKSDLNSKQSKNKTKIPDGNNEKLFEKDKKF